MNPVAEMSLFGILLIVLSLKFSRLKCSNSIGKVLDYQAIATSELSGQLCLNLCTGGGDSVG